MGLDPEIPIPDPASLDRDNRVFLDLLESLRSAFVQDTLDTLVLWSVVATLVVSGLAVGLGYYTAGRALR